MPLRVVNTNLTPVTLHKSSRNAIAEHISETAICNTTISDQVESGNVHDIELADPLPSDITETERKQFLAFLITLMWLLLIQGEQIYCNITLTQESQP